MCESKMRPGIVQVAAVVQEHGSRLYDEYVVKKA